MSTDPALVFALCPGITATADSARTARDHLCPDFLLFDVSATLYIVPRVV